MRLLEVVGLFLIASPAFAQEKLTLEEAVRRAVARNPTALIAEQEIRRAEGILKEVRAPAMPQLSLNGSYTRNDSSHSTTTGQVVIPLSSVSANATLSVPLFAPQRWLATARAGEQIDIARSSAEDSRRAVAVATARAYLTVMNAHRLVQITTQARDSAKAHLDDAHARFEVGSGNRLDEVRAGQDMAGNEAALALAEGAVVRTREALGVLVGTEGPVEVEDQIALPAPPAPAEALRDAEEIRPDVIATKQRAETARKAVRDSWADYMPLLTAVLEPFYNNTNPDIASIPEKGWQAQLVLTIPLYDGGARYGLQRERSATYEESKAQLEGLLRQARSDVRASFESVRRADESLQSARLGARLAHEALEMTTLAYREGATNDLEVVDAARRARDADVAALVAEDTARQARIDLLYASGRFP
ncbi:MAG TPA: TolC family protein [Myxococcales bacterium]|nr:TolC family protein [Myxococcales bacterium]